MNRIFLLLLICLNTRAQYYPDKNWQTKTPQELGMNQAMLDSAIRFAQANEVKIETDLRLAILKAYAAEPNFKIYGPTAPRGKSSGLIIRNGYIVSQWGDGNRNDMIFSVAKSYLSAVAGLAFDAKLINSVDDPVGRYVPTGEFNTPHNSKITWRHLLTQSSDWSGCLFDVCDWADRPPSTGSIDDWKARKLNEPGSVYEYNDVRVNLLAYSLLQVFRKPLPQVLREKIMDPIDASTTWRWHGYDNSFVNVDGIMMQSVSGGGHFGGGLFINNYDMARFGLLFARKGKWNNQQLISPQWISEMRKPSATNAKYGFLWWLDENPGLPVHIYSANGFGGNFIVVDDMNDLIIIARWLDPSKLGELTRLVLSSLTKTGAK